MSETEIVEGVGVAAEHRYAWAVARLREAFPPPCRVWSNDFNYGHGFGVAVGRPNETGGWAKRVGAKLEHSWITNYDAGTSFVDDEEQQWCRHPPEGGWTYETYSLNAEPDREARLEELIKRLRVDLAD